MKEEENGQIQILSLEHFSSLHHPVVTPGNSPLNGEPNDDQVAESIIKNTKNSTQPSTGWATATTFHKGYW